jgi:hypothetical protein
MINYRANILLLLIFSLTFPRLVNAKKVRVTIHAGSVVPRSALRGECFPLTRRATNSNPSRKGRGGTWEKRPLPCIARERGRGEGLKRPLPS